jgi:hypothetical protein
MILSLADEGFICEINLAGEDTRRWRKLFVVVVLLSNNYLATAFN